MPMRKRLLVLLFLMPMAVAAQSSLVPVTHPVYDWLLTQRVAGRVPTYQHEVRPHSRGEILGQLRRLETMPLSASDRAIRDEFLMEFDIDRLRGNRLDAVDVLTGLPRSLPRNIRARTEPFLYAGGSSESAFHGAVNVNIGLAQLNRFRAGADAGSYVATKGIRAFVNSKSGWGLLLEADNAAFFGERELFQRDDRWGYGYGLNVDSNFSSYSTEAFVSFAGNRWNVDFGAGTQAMGVGVQDPLMIRANAPATDFLRFRIGTPTLNLLFLHAGLFAEPSFGTMPYAGDSIRIKTTPQRWLAAHRLTWMPDPRLSVSIHEMVVYSSRGPDPAYLNFLNPYLFAEIDNGDRDNNFAGMDVVMRPLPGTEWLGGLLIDDLDGLSSLWNEEHTKVAYVLGWRQLLPGAVRAEFGYTRADAWTYTHWMRLNTLEQRGRPLGPELGPNHEEYVLKLTRWLPWRTRLTAGLGLRKKGLNPPGTNVGGDLLEGEAATVVGVPLYRGAQVQAARVWELDLESEPIRGLNLSLAIEDLRVTRGDRWASERYLDFRLRYGF